MTTEEDRPLLSTEVSPQEHISDDHVQSEAADTFDLLRIGDRLSGRYRIERELGQGGMGVVYLVTDQQVIGETFAVKVLKESLYPQALHLLREEVNQTRKLSHPNIVDVHSVNVDGQRLYVLMEYLEGRSMDVLLNEEFGRGMPFSHAWPIIEDVGAALGNAHDHNVIHSDLKPANVFVTTAGRTKLLDFGIARVSRGPLLRARSGPRALTPEYASCEMLEGKEADARDDIYSFACAIYEMLSGKRPFGELTALEAREAGAKVPPLAALSRKQNGALAKALAFDRQRRTGSVEELLSGLADKKPRGRQTAVLGVIAAVAALGLTYFALDKLLISRQSVVVQSAARLPAPTLVAFNPPPHSIAVLPFANISGDASQEYFSDGMTEELLNSLSGINELQVVGRTSSFYFKGKDVDLGTIARKLNVATVLEGSVRRSGHTVRITTQLINAVTGFHLWSQTYDRNLGDILTLQTQVANAVASALKVTLVADVAAKVEVGGTHNPGAFDAFLRALKATYTQKSEKDLQDAIADYTEAVRRDPHYALAFAGRSQALRWYISVFATGSAIREGWEKVQADARKAIALAPDLAVGHSMLAGFLADGSHDFARANEEYERALALAPGNVPTLREYGLFAVWMGRTEAGLAAARRAVLLDPLNRNSHHALAWALIWARQYKEAIAAFQDTAALDPDFDPFAGPGRAYYGLGNYQSARASCERKPDSTGRQLCLALTYHKLGRHADAEAMLAKFQASEGDTSAYEYAEIYAQWGNTAKALRWLDTAIRLRDSSLEYLKVDPLLDPLRKEPRFQAIERELKFPQ